MPARQRLRNLGQDARNAIRRSRESSREAASSILAPDRFDRFQATRGEQVIALLFVGPVVVATLPIIVVLNDLMTDVFLNGETIAQNQQNIAGWLVTGITGGAFLLAAWFWFQFVRTGGFGLFTEGGLK